MEKTEIDNYRDKIDLQLKEKVTDIESNISLIIVGSLGFLLTVNEKFIGLKEADLKWLLLLSVASLLFAFAIFLFNKHLTTKYDRKIIDFLDDAMKPDNDDCDQELLKMWTKYDTKLSRNRNVIYWLVGIGILLEIFFFLFNVLNEPVKKQDELQKIRIEIITKDTLTQALKVSADTSNLKNSTNMTDKKKPIDSKTSKQVEKKPLSESQRTFSDSEAKKHEKFYISKPKITSQSGNSDGDQKK